MRHTIRKEQIRKVSEDCARCKVKAGEACREPNGARHCITDDCVLVYETNEEAVNCAEHATLKQPNHI